MKQIKIDFEKFDGDLNVLIDSSSDGDKYLLQMVNKEEEDEIEVKMCEVNKISNGMMGIINGHFSTDYHNFMKIIGICKLIV